MPLSPWAFRALEPSSSSSSVSSRVSIRLVYGTGLDIVQAERLGTHPDGSELHRVWRRGLVPGDPIREDVLRLRPQEGPAFDFIGSADPARPETAHLTIASRCLGMPACNEFRRRLDEHGCVLENQWSSGNAFYLVFTHASDVPIHEWHAQMLRDSLGIAPDELRDYLHDEERTRERERARRKTRDKVRRSLSRGMRLTLSLLSLVATAALVVVIIGGGATKLIVAESADRPRFAAMAMLVTLAPSVLTRDGRKMWPLFLGCAMAALGALALVDGPTPSYGGATALGALYALVIGALGVVIAIFSLFSSNAGQLGLVWFGIVFPAVGSAAAAAVLAVTAAAAAGSAGGLGNGARTVAIALTALVLLAPAGVLFSYVTAIVGGKGWKGNWKLQVRALATLPRAMLPLLKRVAIPIAIIWSLAWLLGR
jgi:hypothetical protein